MCFFCSCSKDNTVFSSTEELLISNPWSVDYYFHHQDMTEVYGNSMLLFSSTGAVGFRQNGNTVGGKWSSTIDASNNELIDLQFNTADIDIMDLNKSWILTSRTTNSLLLEQTDGADTVVLRLRK